MAAVLGTTLTLLIKSKKISWCRILSTCGEKYAIQEKNLVKALNNSTHQGSYISEMGWAPLGKCLFWNANDSILKLMVSIASCDSVYVNM